MSLPKLILRRNEERLRAKAFEALAKAKLVEEITEAVRLLNLEMQEEKQALYELMAKMKELAGSLDEMHPADGGSHLQSALRHAAQALGESHLRLPSEIGNMLTDTGKVEKAADSAFVRPEAERRPSKSQATKAVSREEKLAAVAATEA